MLAISTHPCWIPCSRNRLSHTPAKLEKFPPSKSDIQRTRAILAAGSKGDVAARRAKRAGASPRTPGVFRGMGESIEREGQKRVPGGEPGTRGVIFR